ncbi:SOS response-associated peptidase family protein [Rhizobium sp. XQZ8]|uniref:SOS response-associated peptidase family protein n=1 Tax=Rhizobium populisoli TaxID=2859785 RepID=UPI001CA491F0|nr:SOS response-associated peptidase family protein [Rhizobium populisoli]MBW6425442.1 SOS response-associated peptidase family protein [Rhizobium populisoli]
MSRLFAVTKSIEEIVEHFGIDVPASFDVPSETIEGTQGLIVFEKNGLRNLKSIPWGFPRKTRDGPPTRLGLVADLTNPMWERTVVDPRYRCLIPITHFANPDGRKGEKTRTWFSLNRQPLLAWAGFCRNTPEFGAAFAGMTGEANERVRPLNDRMPILLKPEEYERWLHGNIQEVIRFQFRDPMRSEDLDVLETRDRWQSGSPPRGAILRPSSRSML